MSVLFKSIFILINLSSVILAKQHVPVLFWGRSVSLPSVPALKQLSTIGFSEVLQDALGSTRPLIAVFLEKELSSEDFSLRTPLGENLYEDLKATINRNNVEYFPSVVKPLEAVKDLVDKGYDVLDYEGEVPLNKPTVLIIDLLEGEDGRANTLSQHFKTIQNIYNKIVKTRPDVVALYTGYSNSWSEKSIKRVRREDPPAPTPPALVMSDGGFVALANTITYKKDATSEPLDLNTVVSTVLTNGTGPETSMLQVTFNDNVKLAFVFNGTTDKWQWYLTSILHEDNKALVPSVQIWAPRKWSWHCAQEVDFAASPLDVGSTDKAVVNITGFQVQPFMEEAKFGQAIDCVPYFSIAIWTGIVVVVLMLFILVWGLLMILDINNNDRFDDPKGKTITIAANE